jgi:hypothetical protein
LHLPPFRNQAFCDSADQLRRPAAMTFSPLIRLRLFDADEGRLPARRQVRWPTVVGRLTQTIRCYGLDWHLVELSDPPVLPAELAHLIYPRAAQPIRRLVVGPPMIRARNYQTPRDAIRDALTTDQSIFVGVSACVSDDALPTADIDSPDDRTRFARVCPYLCAGELSVV